MKFSILSLIINIFKYNIQIQLVFFALKIFVVQRQYYLYLIFHYKTLKRTFKQKITNGFNLLLLLKFLPSQDLEKCTYCVHIFCTKTCELIITNEIKVSFFILLKFDYCLNFMATSITLSINNVYISETGFM